MKVFVAGIMQGSIQSNDIHDQGYRQRISAVVRSCFPAVEIIDPWELHPDSPSYDDGRARQTFFHFCDQAGRVDLLIAYVPEASMGTAIEMWEAYRHGIPVIAISPLETWAVRFLSWRCCRSVEELAALLQQARPPTLWPAECPPLRADGEMSSL